MARRATLSYCQTPTLGTSSRLSVGIKRQSLVRSATKYGNVISTANASGEMAISPHIMSYYVMLYQTILPPLTSTHFTPVDDNDVKRLKLQPTQQRQTIKKSPAKSHTSLTFTGLIGDIKEFTINKGGEGGGEGTGKICPDFLTVLEKGVKTFGDGLIDSDITEVIVAALGETNLSSLSDEALDKEWTALSQKMDHLSAVEALAEEGKRNVRRVAEKCVENIDGKYTIWESRLLEISADAVEQKIEEVKATLEQEQREKNAVERDVAELELEIPITDRKSAESELFDLRNTIRLTREALEKSKGEIHDSGKRISSLLLSKQEILSSRVSRSASAQGIAEKEAEAQVV